MSLGGEYVCPCPSSALIDFTAILYMTPGLRKDLDKWHVAMQRRRARHICKWQEFWAGIRQYDTYYAKPHGQMTHILQTTAAGDMRFAKSNVALICISATAFLDMTHAQQKHLNKTTPFLWSPGANDKRSANQIIHGHSFMRREFSTYSMIVLVYFLVSEAVQLCRMVGVPDVFDLV